jgi:protein TonB
MAAVALSLGVHAAALAVRFVDPEILRWRSAAPPLEIVLVNARTESAPTNAQALAQANLDGGGAHDQGMRTSPLPNTFEMRDGDTLESAKHAVQQLEKRPRKHFFMPSTSEYRFARYVEDWRGRVEKIGNDNYPEEARGKIYGNLKMTVVIRKDGSLMDAIINQSSGSAVLDRAARRIVKLAAPYPPFPPDVARDTDILEITRTWVFTNDQFATRSAPGIPTSSEKQ